MTKSILQNRVMKVAARVISLASREHPADSVLRAELKKERDLPREASGEVARSVFSFYRWFGWLDQKASIRSQLIQAIELADAFKKKPAQFSDADLIARAIPSWVAEEMEIPAAWVRALQEEPRLWLRARPGQASALSAMLDRCEISNLLPDALVYMGEEDLFQTSSFQAGEFELQDIGSQAVGWICNPQPGQTWWDACAGEGGKTLHLADLMSNKGLIWATDRAEWRLQKLKRRTARAKVFNYRSAIWNGEKKLPTKTQFDGILVDAPCSGIGTWQRNPQARWTTSAEDVRELAIVQAKLLAHVAPALKKGGRLIYSVCTLAQKEATGVTELLSKEFPELQPLAFANPLAPSHGTLSRQWLWPQDHQGNGMFVSAWARA